ncbi:MAG: SDR family NAD(P)-dependent oxidoreductase [Methylobacterium sp.]|jgi:short-subunit dehydrogenase
MQMTIAIIGAGPGIGMALARRFGREGHAIGLIARSQGIDTLAAELAAEGLKAKAYRADATVPSTIGEVLADIEANLGPVNVMVFNAAAVSYLPLTQLTPAQLVADFTVGVASALAASQAVAPGMIARGGGSILLTGGGFAYRPVAALASLGVQKAGLRNLAFSLAEDLGPKGIRVGTVSILGMVKPETDFDPALIAERFWALHQDRANDLGVESLFEAKS